MRKNRKLFVAMVDTTIFARTREKLIEKVRILEEYCNTNGTKVNESKTKAMAFNGDPKVVGVLEAGECVAREGDLDWKAE